MNKAWPALASLTYIGCACLPLEGCGQYDDRGLFAPPPGGDAGSGGAGGASSTASAGGASNVTATSAATTSTTATSTTTTAGTGGTGGAAGAGTGVGGAAGSGRAGGGGSIDDGGPGSAGRSGAGGSSGGAAGTHGGAGAGGNAGSTADAGVPKVCADLHTAAKTARESAISCTQAGSFSECRLAQDECGCGVGVRIANAQAIQRYQMAVQALKDNGCFDACPDAGCPPYTGVTCTPGTQSRLQCIAY